MSRDNIQIEEGAFVSKEAKLTGTIYVAAGCIIHPKSVILAQVMILNKPSSPS
jgi:carbonic anhydrase/acetyltransferase-like protein (isoleucine patch superfamily)